MKKADTSGAALEAKQRVEEGLEALRQGLAPYVAKHMEDRYGSNWGHTLAGLKAVSAAKSWMSTRCSRRCSTTGVTCSATTRVSARRAVSFPFVLTRATAPRISAANSRRAKPCVTLMQCASFYSPWMPILKDKRLIRFTRSNANRTELPQKIKQANWNSKSRWRHRNCVHGGKSASPTRTCLESRFSDAEFAANLALVNQGEGSEEYLDPAAFFRITYATEGLRRVLTTTIARLAGEGGDPVIGLQTNFGGGKTHTMLALHHLAGAMETGYRPQELYGMAEIFEAAGVETLSRVKRAVFVGTHKGAAEAMHIEEGREIRTLWGYIAWCLGGWVAFDSIAGSESARTNPGSEKLIPILRNAAPCLILMDEVVAFARQLRGFEYDAFIPSSNR